ncbi:MAG: glycosyltransferase family 39 protein [Clostridia bacterium]|nr:glycosyltransferase family 39 protein [Clostridia bacterium]
MNPLLLIIFAIMCIAAVNAARKSGNAFSSDAENENTSAVLSFLYKHEKKLAVLILIIGILVRISFFWVTPDGLNQDEASLAYDAYADLTYGQDRNGDHNPVYSVAWGSGHSSFYITFTKLFIALFGLNVFSVRATNVLFGVIALFAFWGIAKRINRRSAVISLFLFAICPWHIMMCRWGLDCNVFPNVFLLGLYFLMRGLEDKRWYPVSMVIFGLSLYGYGAAYMTVPVFLLLTAVYLLYNKKITVKMTVVSAAVFLVVALPIIIFMVINTFGLSELNLGFITIPKLISGRYNSTVTVLSGGLGAAFKNLSVLTSLLFVQYDGLPWNAIPEYGTLYLFSVPFLILGIIYVIKNTAAVKKKYSPMALLLFMLIASLVLAILSKLNINRANFMYPALIMVLAEGILYVITHLKKPAYAILPIYLCVFLLFTGTYFTSYREKIGHYFFLGTGDAITYAIENTNDDIYITEKINGPYVFALFYDKTDPQVFIDTVDYENPNSQVRKVNSFDRFITGIPEELPDDGAFILHKSEKEKFADKYNLKEFGNYYVATKK